MGGSSGSGGSSGAVSYPAYMQSQHETWLTAVAGLIVTATTGGSPYASATAYDPDCALAATNYIISLFYAEVVAMTPATDWSTYYTAAAAKYTPATITAITAYSFTDIFTAGTVAALVAAYQADLEARRDASYKPAYKVGMLNVNSVMNSSFVLGDTLITAEVAREVAKFSADLNFQNEQKKLEYQNIQGQYNLGHNSNIIKRDNVIVSHDTANRAFNASVADAIMAKDIAHLGLYQALSQITTDANRIKIVAKVEETEKNYKYDEQDAIWDLEMYQYGGNMLASIAGAASSTKGKEVSTGASVLGGAMSGAAAGASIGGPWGAAIGGVVGGIAGLLN